MNRKKEFLYFILILMKEITSALTGTSLLQYDITKVLNHWFSNILHFNIDPTLKNVETVFEIPQEFEYRLFEYDLEHEVEPFPRKFFFGSCFQFSFNKPANFFVSQSDWNLRKNEISVTSEFVYMALSGSFGLEKDSLDRFGVNLNFKNFKLLKTALPYGNRSMHISYDSFFADCLKVNNSEWWENGTLQFIARKTLIEELKPAFIIMLEKFMNRNSKHFDSAFKSILSISKQTKQEVISTKEDIFQKGRKYYYLIPTIPFCCGFTLKTVVIKGLSNIESLKFYRKPRPFSHSVLMDDVHGSMVLDYERVEEKPLQLRFKIDRLSMSIVHANNCVIVEAPEFSVNSTGGPLTRRQSAVLVQLIESAIVSSLMPSKQVCDMPNDSKVPVAIKLRITEASDDWSKIKGICHEWIPFNVVSSKENYI